VRLAIFADIHANRQAFSACLDFARARGAERIVCLGDVVGYGADPEWAVDTVMGLVDDGAIAVIGNHDHAISAPSESMNAVATAAIEWTRGRLSAPQRQFLAELPLTQREDDRLYVHSEASHPSQWRYVRDTPDAATRDKHPKIVRVTWGAGYPPARTSLDLPLSREIATIMTAAGHDPVRLPTVGGSIPMYLFQQPNDTPVIGLPIANHDDNQHAADENLRLQNLWDGIEIYAALFVGLTTQ